VPAVGLAVACPDPVVEDEDEDEEEGVAVDWLLLLLFTPPDKSQAPKRKEARSISTTAKRALRGPP
jgi:hypothetical protein